MDISINNVDARVRVAELDTLAATTLRIYSDCIKDENETIAKAILSPLNQS